MVLLAHYVEERWKVSYGEGLKCNFKVLGMVQFPCKICGTLPVLQRAPCISGQADILTKFRLTSSLENLRSHGKALFEAW